MIDDLTKEWRIITDFILLYDQFLIYPQNHNTRYQKYDFDVIFNRDQLEGLSKMKCLDHRNMILKLGETFKPKHFMKIQDFYNQHPNLYVARFDNLNDAIMFKLSCP